VQRRQRREFATEFCNTIDDLKNLRYFETVVYNHRSGRHRLSASGEAVLWCCKSSHDHQRCLQGDVLRRQKSAGTTLVNVCYPAVGCCQQRLEVNDDHFEYLPKFSKFQEVCFSTHTNIDIFLCYLIDIFLYQIVYTFFRFSVLHKTQSCELNCEQEIVRTVLFEKESIVWLCRLL
jgi:hypothetical protein